MIGALAMAAMPLIKKLAGEGLTTLTNALLAKGKDAIETTLGVNLDEKMKTEQGIYDLRMLEVKLEEYLLSAALEEKRVDYRFLMENQKEITDRWEADNKAGGLNRLVRPCSLIFLLVVYSFMAFTDNNFFPIKEVYATGFESLLFIAMPSYFGARAIEKIKGRA